MTRKAIPFSNAADANENTVSLARKVCEIFHVFADANALNNFPPIFLTRNWLFLRG
jgi:hypothetical protein